jgi:hydrogenase maturation protease
MRTLTQMKAALVVGIGNASRGDDAAGLMVADLAGTADSGLAAIRHEADGAALLDVWTGYEMVVIVDAMVSGAVTGTIRTFSNRESLPRSWFGSGAHVIGLPEALDLALTLDRLPPKVLIIGIEGRRFGLGEPVSPEVHKAVKCVARDLPHYISGAHEKALVRVQATE